MADQEYTRAELDALAAAAISTPLVTHIYTADPSAHVFEGKVYIYPSHDVEGGVAFDDDGGDDQSGLGHPTESFLCLATCVSHVLRHHTPSSTKRSKRNSPKSRAKFGPFSTGVARRSRRAISASTRSVRIPAPIGSVENLH